MKLSQESAKEHPLVAETRKNVKYPEFPTGILLSKDVWDRKGEQPVNR